MFAWAIILKYKIDILHVFTETTKKYNQFDSITRRWNNKWHVQWFFLEELDDGYRLFPERLEQTGRQLVEAAHLTGPPARPELHPDDIPVRVRDLCRLLHVSMFSYLQTTRAHVKLHNVKCDVWRRRRRGGGGAEGRRAPRKTSGHAEHVVAKPLTNKRHCRGRSAR